MAKGLLSGEQVIFEFEVGNTFKVVKEDDENSKYEWTLFVRMTDKDAQKKICHLIEKVHFGMLTQPYVVVKSQPGKPIKYDCVAWRNFNTSNIPDTPIEIFW